MVDNLSQLVFWFCDIIGVKRLLIISSHYRSAISNNTCYQPKLLSFQMKNIKICLKRIVELTPRMFVSVCN